METVATNISKWKGNLWVSDSVYQKNVSCVTWGVPSSYSKYLSQSSIGDIFILLIKTCISGLINWVPFINTPFNLEIESGRKVLLHSYFTGSMYKTGNLKHWIHNFRPHQHNLGLESKVTDISPIFMLDFSKKNVKPQNYPFPPHILLSQLIVDSWVIAARG